MFKYCALVHQHLLRASATITALLIGNIQMHTSTQCNYQKHTRHTIRTAAEARDREGGGDTKQDVDKERVRTPKGT